MLFKVGPLKEFHSFERLLVNSAGLDIGHFEKKLKVKKTQNSRKKLNNSRKKLKASAIFHNQVTKYLSNGHKNPLFALY